MKILKITLITLFLISLSGCLTTSKGEKVGIIVKIAQEGMFIKTWEGELIRGSLSNGNGAFGAPFFFTIEDKAVSEKATQALDNQKTVKITYHKEWWIAPWRSDYSHNIFIDNIEILN